MRTITTRALIGRLNRKLAKEDQVIRTSRGSSAIQNLGDFYVVDIYRNAIVDHNLTIETLQNWARDMGAMRPSEILAE